MNIFEFAMQKEKLSAEYYHELAEKALNTGIKNILLMLAGEEEKHFKIVSKMKEGVPAEMAETTILAGAKEVFEKMRQSAEKLDLDTDEVELYKTAQGIETNAREYYLEKAECLEQEDQKQMFIKLADEEKKHYLLLDNIIEMVLRPERWLENAEFVHLDEY